MKNLRTGTAKFDTIRAKDANGLHLQDDAGNGLFIKDGGNVGIGTTNPSAKLDIQSSSNTVTTSKFYNGGGSAPATVHIVEDGAASDHVGLFVGTSDLSSAVLITKQNNVGIGTTSPGGKLHVTDLSVSIGSVTVTNTGTGVTGGTSLNTKISNGDRIKINNQIFTVSAVADTTLTLSGTPTTAGTFTAYTDSNALFVTSSGNVGIGTTSPGAKLHLSTAGADGLRLAVDSQTYYHMIRPNGDGLYLGADDGGTGGVGADIRFSVKGDEKMRIDSAGKLHVNGLITGGFGARSTTTDPAYKDWNHASNARGGMGHYLLFGDDTNGPEVGLGLGNRYFHIFNFEYGSKDGTGSLTQWAIGYIQNLFYMRTRYLGTWTAWTAII